MPLKALFSFLVACCLACLWDAQVGHAVYAGLETDGRYYVKPHTETHTVDLTRNVTMTQDETLRPSDAFWLGRAEGTSGVNRETLHDFETSASGEFASYPFARYAEHQPSRRGASLITLAEFLRRSDPQLRAAILRHFAHSVAKLRNPYVGLGDRSGSLGQLGEVRLESQLEGLMGKLKGLVAAADSYMTHVAMSAPLLIPFGIVMRDAEDLFYRIARKGDADAMISALDGLGPLLVRGLSYLQGDPSPAASGVINPVRNALIERARELDAALLEGQRNPGYLLHRYASDMNEEFLERERQMAGLEGGRTGATYIPPPLVSSANYRSLDEEKESAKGLVIFFIWLGLVMLLLAFSRHLSSEFEERHSVRDFRENVRYQMNEFEERVETQRRDARMMGRGLFVTPSSPPVVSHISRHVRFSAEIGADQFPTSPAGAPARREPRAPWENPPPSYEEVMRETNKD